MKRLTITPKLWAILSAIVLLAAACNGAPAALPTAVAPAPIENRGDDTRAQPADGASSSAPTQDTAGAAARSAPAFASPLPTPEPQPQDEIEFTGLVEVMASDMWVVGGRTLVVTSATEIKPGLDIGVLAKVHAVQQPDSSLLAREIEPARRDDGSQNGNVNSNDSDDDNLNGNVNSNVNSNEDNGDDEGNGNLNANEDNDNDNLNGNVNSNDDNGTDEDNSNLNSNEDNDNDTHNDNVNSNDDDAPDGSNDNSQHD